MALLSKELADLIQYVSLPLEFIGILLAVIEIRFPKLAEIASNHILAEATRYKKPITLKRVIEMIGGVALGLGLAYIAKTSDNPLLLDLAMFTCVAVALSYIFSAYWIPDRAVGTLGLFLACIGLSGELYQLVVNTYIS